MLRPEEVPDEEVQKEIATLEGDFNELSMDIYTYITKTKPDFDEFAVFISLPVSSWKTKRPKQMTDIDLDRIMEPDAEFRQMFIVVNQYTNWYNYELMDNIAKRYGNPELKGKMGNYCLKMADFERRTSAEKLKNIVLARPLAASASIIAILPHNHCNQFRGSELRRAKHRYTEEAGLNPAAVRMYMVREKSPVEIIFLVPISLAAHLMVSSLIISPLLTSQEPLPEDMHERCVYYMNAEEVFRLMGVSTYGMK